MIKQLATLKVSGNEYEIQGILFDKDGTLIELHTLWSTWFERLWEEIELRQPNTLSNKQVVAESIGLDMSLNIISAKGPLAIGTMQDIAIILAYHLYQAQLSWNESVQTIRNSMNKVHETIDWDELLAPVKGVKAFLEKAQKSGVKMSVVTSDDTEIAIKHLKSLKIAHFFHTILGSDEINYPKPFPDIGNIACEGMKVDPRHTIMIGDTNSDMKLGHNLETKASIGVLPARTEDDSHLTDATYIIRDYNQLSID